ncbi:DUF221-domain-containing protein [Microthyrium microscopicum]|uniref:DUF221-domain-containing protein n=1 Tax=Microthyrium microscopicum TaxID=703497 RepID=A0A6A6UMN6_9PEZI|nr:DUF221-domain-containing protein [Microthyrium microscopicum]
MSDIITFLNGTVNGNAGAAQNRVGTTITTLLISLAAGFVLFFVQFTLFLIIRNYLWAKRIYQPRSYLVPFSQRVKPPHANPFKWLWHLFKIPEDPDVLHKAGMDAYFFIRYLSMCLKIFAPMAVIIMPILIPLNVKGGKGTSAIGNYRYNVTGLDTLGWSNVSPANTNRYWAHLVLAIGAVVWVCFVFHQELLHYIQKRGEYLSSPGHRLKASSTTVLIQDIPKTLCDVESLEELYGDFPGGIRRIWINRDFTALVNKDTLRRKYEDLLENAETDMLRKAMKRSRKMKNLTEATRNGATSLDSGLALHHSNGTQMSGQGGPRIGPGTPESCQRDLEYDIKSQAAWTKYIKPKHRSTMRIPKENHAGLAKIPLIGRFFCSHIDTIYYCRRELARLNKEIEMDTATEDAYPQNYSAFIQFNSQKAAHLACQSVADTTPSRMRRRLVEISPGDINWPSLNITWKSRYIRLAGFLTLFLLVLIVFGIISFATGILSRASTLSDTYTWLRWISNLPPWLLSFVQGTLPPVIQVIVLSGPLPIVLRAMTNKTRGATTGQEGERSLQMWYFIFLMVELVVIPTVSSGLTSIVGDLIRSPASVPNILAQNLPTAANYYFSFLILQALSLSATSILQTIRLFKFYVIGHVNTPDSVFQKLSWTNLTRIGSNIPWYTTFAVIGLVYCVIAPLMLLFVLITFSLFWVVIKNNLLYCVRTGQVDGAGLFFPSAVTQLFTGLYIMEFCLTGLFFLVRDINDKVACDTQGIIMGVVIALTALYQIWLTHHLSPLYKYAPVRLDSEAKALLAEYDEVRRSHSSAGDDEDTTELEKTETNTLQPSNAASHRSQDFQAQQREDRKSAQRILNRLNRPLDEARLAHLENKFENRASQIVPHAVPHAVHALMPRRKDIEAQMMNDPISKIIMQHNDEIENLAPEERDMLISIAFAHPVLRESKPGIWIPTDDLGISDDEVARTRAFSEDLAIDNRGAFFDKKLKVQVDKQPPDMSEFALIMPEL